MNIVDIIIKKRDRHKLTREEINFFVSGVTDGTISDYQTSALLMAVFLNGLDRDETFALTDAMTHSGKTFDFSSINGTKVDKHSTGGVADTTTLILAPLVASCGVPVIKMSGRGLGFSGGTIDKLESIPNFRTNIDESEALQFAKESGIVLMGQSDGLVPADKKLYALRDVTGTVESIPLIVSSIMSKKIAAGADAIVLDVKCGSGAFMKNEKDALELSKQMTEIGKYAKRKVTAVISSMDQPLGMNIGNSLEVIEAIEVLKGNVKGDLYELTLTLGACMLKNAGKVLSIDEGKKMLEEKIKDGSGLNKFRELLIQQSGSDSVVDDYSLLPHASTSKTVYAKEDGFICGMDTDLIGKASVATCAGRIKKEDKIDYGAGIIMNVRIGDKVKMGDKIAEVFSASDEKCEQAEKLILSAVHISKNSPDIPKLIKHIIE
ncbi:MAG: thymidine phosphorylase [Clostridia bacterium]|jgi:pyrimidine-nucleoside phosphorylase|nr:thymidine phosphorylase [Clostridia bacterium]MCI2000897.1 thymidine phosphorylase [Clostridia bacterium]MCI2015681.1 thymidine phosphorylase [Clostridia bacterium]